MHLCSFLEGYNLHNQKFPHLEQNGRTELTEKVVQAIIRAPEVESFSVISSFEIKEPGIKRIRPDRILDDLKFTNLVWFEPSRHYSWRPALLRHIAGREFPIISLAHSVGYAELVLPMLASAAIPSRQGDIVIAPSRQCADVLNDQFAYLADVMNAPEAPRPAVKVIPYGVPESPQMDYHHSRESLGIHPNSFAMLALGRIDHRDKSDFASLLRTLARLRHMDCDACLVLAGFSGSEDSISKIEEFARKSGVSDYLQIHSDVSEQRKHELISACDALVALSNTTAESFGLALVEAMLHGKPVVATSWSGYREIVCDGHTGFLIDTTWNAYRAKALDAAFTLGFPTFLSQGVAVDINQLVDRLYRLARDPKLCRSLGEAGRVRAQELFTFDRFVSSLVEVFQDSAGQAKTCRRPAYLKTRSGFASMFRKYATTSIDDTDELVLHADIARIMQDEPRGMNDRDNEAAKLLREISAPGNGFPGLEAPGIWNLVRAGFLMPASRPKPCPQGPEGA